MHFYKLLASEIETNMVSDRNADFTPTLMNVTGNVVSNCSRYSVMKFKENTVTPRLTSDPANEFFG